MEFITKINGNTVIDVGIIEEIYETSVFPYCIRLDHPISLYGCRISYVNSDKIKKI